MDFATSGSEAINAVSETGYNLILMDIQLPGMDGTEAMKKIREIYQKHVPVIALTASAMKGDRINYLNQGFDEYISKPISISSLKRKIQEVLE